MVLEGSKTSYAQFKKWDGGTDSSLSFEFRTESSDGLLVYTDDPSTCDSLELKLVEGRLRLRMNTGAGPTILQSSQALPSLADGAWHRVAVVKLSTNTTLQVPNINHGYHNISLLPIIRFNFTKSDHHRGIERERGRLCRKEGF